MSIKEEFVDKYVNYLLKMNFISDIDKFDKLFYQLLLFLHKDTKKYNNHAFSHKLKDNCFYINKEFINDVTLQDNGRELEMFVKYIKKYCPSEMDEDYFGCDFKCPLLFTMISEKLKHSGYSKQKLFDQQEELNLLKLDPEKLNEYECKLNKFKQDLITVKNICLFRSLVNKNN